MKSKPLSLMISESWDLHKKSNQSLRIFSKIVFATSFIALIILASSCSKGIRLQAKFDSETVNTAPNSQPSPNPPQDFFSWGQIDVTARVIAGTGTNKLVRVVPTPSYINSGKYAGFVLNAFSEPLSGNIKRGVRGGVTVNMRGSGKMVIYFKAAQGPNMQGDPLGGYLFINPGIPSIGYMSSFDLIVMQGNNSLVNSTFLNSYTPGQPVELRWSIDQDSRIMVLGATPQGGTLKSQTVSFQQLAKDGSQNTPLQKIWLSIEFFEISANAEVQFDDFQIEEY